MLQSEQVYLPEKSIIDVTQSVNQGDSLACGWKGKARFYV